MQCKLVGVVLQTCLGIDCVEYEVRVYVVRVGVSCNYNFVSWEGSLRKLDSYFVSKCRLNLIAAGVRLDEVIVTHSVSLAVHLTGIFELLIGSLQRTVKSRHELLVLGLVVAADVVKTFLSTAAVLNTYRCDCRHYFTSLRS